MATEGGLSAGKSLAINHKTPSPTTPQLTTLQPQDRNNRPNLPKHSLHKHPPHLPNPPPIHLPIRKLPLPNHLLHRRRPRVRQTPPPRRPPRLRTPHPRHGPPIPGHPLPLGALPLHRDLAVLSPVPIPRAVCLDEDIFFKILRH